MGGAPVDVCCAKQREPGAVTQILVIGACERTDQPLLGPPSRLGWWEGEARPNQTGIEAGRAAKEEPKSSCCCNKLGWHYFRRAVAKPLGAWAS